MVDPDKLVKALKRVDARLDRIVSRIATTRETSITFWSKINREIRVEYEKARTIMRVWSVSNIPKEYKDTIKKNFKKIKAKQITTARKIGVNKFAKTNVAKQSVTALTTETVFTYATALNSGERTMIRLASLTQQVNISEKQIEQNIVGGFLETGSAQGAITRTQEALLEKALEGKYIQIIDKNGKTINYKINSYAELVARTKITEASTQAVVDSTQFVGGDLVQVSSHNTLTAYDAQFEGKIYSLSGGDPVFPPASDLPPFHPNCLHTISTVFREGLAAQGNLKKYEDFSTGKVPEHPTQKTFVPISDREFVA